MTLWHRFLPRTAFTSIHGAAPIDEAVFPDCFALGYRWIFDYQNGCIEFYHQGSWEEVLIENEP